MGRYLLRRGVLAAGVVAVVLGASVRPAGAHSGDPSPATNYRSEVTGVEPALDDVDVSVIDLGARVALTVRGDHTVVVLGYSGEPYLRIGPDGVWANTRSPATYFNQDRYGRTVPPPDADAGAQPVWHRVSSARTARWHDHRTHWMSPTPPPEVAADPEVSRIIDRWKIPLLVDGRRATVMGQLAWEPSPAAWPWLSGIAGLTILAAVAGLLRRNALVACAGAAALGVAVHALGLVMGSDLALWRQGLRIALPTVAMGLTVAAAIALRWSLPAALTLVGFSLIATLLVAGHELGELGHSQVPGRLDPLAARLLVALPLGVAGGAVLAVAITAVTLVEAAASRPWPDGTAETSASRRVGGTRRAPP